MNCQRCKSKRIANVSAKHSDNFTICLNQIEYNGYAPNIPYVCEGDYTTFSLCLDCGQVQGTFPSPQLNIEKSSNDQDVLDFFSNHFIQGENFSSSSYEMNHLLKWAEQEVSLSFSIWLSEYIDNNRKNQITSPEEFLKKFKANETYLNHEDSTC